MTVSGMLVAVGRPCPPEIFPSALGVGLNGPPDELYLVFHEDFTPEEKTIVQDGDYAVGIKLLREEDVAGLVWSLVGPGLGMVGYADYSLRRVGDTLGEDVLERFREATRGASLAGSPGRGLPLYVVFVDPGDRLVFGLRVFTLPRLFSDRLLASITATERQDPTRAAELVDDILGSGAKAWGRGLPGVAVAGEELEQSEGEWIRRVRRERERRRRRGGPTR